MSPTKKNSPAAKAAKHAQKANSHAKQAEKHANASKKHAKLATKAMNEAKKKTKKTGSSSIVRPTGGMGLMTRHGTVAIGKKSKSKSKSLRPEYSVPHAYGYSSTGGMGLFSKNGPVPFFPAKK